MSELLEEAVEDLFKAIETTAHEPATDNFYKRELIRSALVKIIAHSRQVVS